MSREPVEITIYTRSDCHLCDIARGRMARIAATEGVPVEFMEVDIDLDEDLRARYTNDVPVIHIGGREVFRHRVLAEPFRRILRGELQNAEVVK